MSSILFLFFGIGAIFLVVILQFNVCKKYLFDNAFTKINEQNKTITVKKQVIPFSNIKNIRVREIELNFAERFLVSVMFFNGVFEMECYLENGSIINVCLPKNYILDFCEKLENNGVNVEY